MTKTGSYKATVLVDSEAPSFEQIKHLLEISHARMVSMTPLPQGGSKVLIVSELDWDGFIELVELCELTAIPVAMRMKSKADL